MEITFNIDESLKTTQAEIFRDTSRFKVVGAGRRYGKSYLATFILLTEAFKKQGNYYFIANTYSQARTILWNILKDKVREGLARKINEQRLEVTLINGSIISLKGGDRADTLRGVSLSGVVFDEFASVRNPEEIWQQVVRPALSDQKGFAVFISSPAGRNFFYDLYTEAKTRKDWKSWQFTTLDGGYVDDEEIASAKHDLDERSFRQEYLASFESFDGLVCPNYDRELNRSYEEIQDDDTLILGVDYNINVMGTVVFVQRGMELHAVDVFYGSFDTVALMEAIEQRYPKKKKVFHTDATGTARKSSAGGMTDIKIIEGYGYRVKNLSKNPSIIDRVNATNSMIMATDGTRRVYVKLELKRLVETLERHTFDDNGMPDKKAGYDHLYDGFSYALWHYSSYGRSKTTITQGR